MRIQDFYQGISHDEPTYWQNFYSNMLVHHEKFLDKSPEFALMDVCRHIDGKV